MIKPRLVLITALFACLATPAAFAQHRGAHHHRGAVSRTPIVCDLRGCSDRVAPAAQETSTARNAFAAVDANGNEVVVGRRPAGCPYEFCGCEASLYLFGKIRRELNLAANWIRKFPRAEPAAGMAAVRRHHVMILMSHVAGKDWLVHDGNSGNHLTREHVRSIAGYVIVDPHGARAASVN